MKKREMKKERILLIVLATIFLISLATAQTQTTQPTLLGQIINAYEGKRAFMPGGGNTKLHMVNVFDVCEAIFIAIENPKSKGEAFNLGSDDVPTLREMVITLYEYAGQKPKFFALGAGTLRFIVKLLSALHISPPTRTSSGSRARASSQSSPILSSDTKSK